MIRQQLTLCNQRLNRVIEAFLFGAILGYASRRFAVEDDPVVEKIDEILPQKIF